jgi:hypothetical protein
MASQYYLNNKNLKNTGVAIEWDATTAKEFKKCAKNQIYFIKKYCRIVHVDKGLVNFDLWPFQENMVNQFENNRFVICKMPRQVGKTTTVAAYLLHKVIFNENFKVAILANKDTQAREILSRIKMMFEYLPKWLQQGVVRWNEGDISLENGSKIVATATTGSSGRGDTYNIIYLDEFAFVPNNLQESFFTSIYPTISSGKTTKTLITSTPHGMNYFYKIWSDSENGKNRYVRCDVHWSQIPGRDKAWQDETIANTSERQFRQEYECEFLGSSNTLIDGQKLAQIPYTDPVVRSGNVDIFEQPKENHIYVMAVDTSRGAGIDYSAFIVFDVTSVPYKVVAKYRNNTIESMVYPTIIYNLGRHYNNAHVLVEVNDVGQQVADILLHDLEYENVISTKVKGRSGQKIGSSDNGIRFALGVRTTVQVKRIGCANFKSLVENDKLIINDYDLLYEMFRFIENNAKYSAEEGEHDDLVMCCVLFSWLVHQSYFKELTDQDARLELLESNRVAREEEMSPFGFIDDVWRDPEGLDDGFDQQFKNWLL